LELEHEAGHEDEDHKIADNEHTIQEMRLLVRLRYKIQLFYMLTMIIRRYGYTQSHPLKTGRDIPRISRLSNHFTGFVHIFVTAGTNKHRSEWIHHWKKRFAGLPFHDIVVDNTGTYIIFDNTSEGLLLAMYTIKNVKPGQWNGFEYTMQLIGAKGTVIQQSLIGF
jgi:hypothetical protein